MRCAVTVMQKKQRRVLMVARHVSAWCATLETIFLKQIAGVEPRYS